MIMRILRVIVIRMRLRIMISEIMKMILNRIMMVIMMGIITSDDDN